MSKKEVQIRYIWSKEIALKASKLYYDYDMKHSSKRYIGWFFVALTQFGIVGALKHNVFGLLYLSTFLVIYWYYGRWYLRKRMLEKFYDKNAQGDKEILFTLDYQGLHFQGQLVDWDHIEKILKFDDGLVIQTDDATLFFANDFFRSFDDKQLFLSIAQEKGKL